MAFLIWSLFSVLFIVMAIICFISKNAKPFGFWANAEMFKVNDVKSYNRALGKLWLVYGVMLEILGIPFLDGQNSPTIIFTIIGTMISSIVLMGIYVMVIEPKYRVK